MSKVFDDTLKEFINKEQEYINSDKERIAEEKARIRSEINNIFKVDCLKRTDEQKEKLEFLQKYYSVLIEQNSLLCKRDLAIFQLIANIGEIARKGSRGVIDSNISESKLNYLMTQH